MKIVDYFESKPWRSLVSVSKERDSWGRGGRSESRWGSRGWDDRRSGFGKGSRKEKSSYSDNKRRGRD
jgi:hypothetical protein